MPQIQLFYDITDADAHPQTVAHNKLIDLLEAVDHHGSLAAAVHADYSVSYRHVWNELKKWEAQIGKPLVVSGRGRPGQLTPFAKKLLAAVRSVHAKYRSPLEAFRTDLLQAFATAQGDSRPVITFTGYPDVAVMKLRKAALQSPFLMDVRFSSSARGLQTLSKGLTQVTGFNLSIGSNADSSAAQAFRPYLQPDKMRVIRFCTRIQGIAVAKGNPLGIHSLLDVSLQKARYAQRAEGTGTRALFDDLLRTSGMRSADFPAIVAADSHVDVANLIGQGKADAGLCLANVAVDAGLDFISISREIYLLACHTDFLDGAVGQSFLTLLRATSWREPEATPAGYDFTGCGEVLQVSEALP